MTFRIPLAATLFLAALFGVQKVCATDRVVLPEDVTPERYDLSIVPDAARLSFAADQSVLLDVHRPVAAITLNAVDLVFHHVTLSGVPGEPQITVDRARETATLHFTAPVTAGGHVLRIAYTGKINENAAGLFALDYDKKGGKARALFTQFENSDARRFMPCWDEPARKAIFVLSATVPADELAVSNMPLAESRALPGQRKRVVFAPSPRMSSYLLFFALGDFERISRVVGGVDIGVIAKRGDTAKAQFALDTATQVLPYYQSYFSVPFPLPKLDLIAAPGQSQFFGAMENWGAIFFFERDLLIDPVIATAQDRRNVYTTIAHEIAHQWFGDLVTMQWWDDIWLNEGFASWMQVKATDHFHPEWKVPLDALEEKEAAMEIDARAGTHPVIQPIRDVLQANEAFDAITYSKGSAVIGMLENYLGAEAFRDGVRRYIKAHVYGNTVSDDLWHALEKSTSAPVARIAHDFTLQAGVPLIRANVSNGRLSLAQDRFVENDPDRSARSWHTPVIANNLDGRWAWRGVVSRAEPVEAVLPSGATTIINSGQAGYFRSLYGTAEFAALRTSFAAVSTADQLGVLNDTRALGLAGYISLSEYASLVTRASAEMEPLVLKSVAHQLQELDRWYEGLPSQARYRAFARAVLSPVIAGVGWDANKGEGANIPVLREAVLGALGQLGDPAVLAEARRRFQIYARRERPFPPDERRIVLSIISQNADQAIWDRLRSFARQTTSSLEKREFYEYLGRARDPALARQTLDVSLNAEVPITTRPAILRRIAVEQPEMALAFLASHFDAFERAIEPDSRAQFAPDIAGNSNDPKTIGVLRAFARQHIPAGARQDEIKAEAAIGRNDRIRRERLPELDHWLAAHPRDSR